MMRVLTIAVPFLAIAMSLPAQSAGRIELDFNASNPVDQLAWLPKADNAQLVAAAEKGNVSASDSWDPLGILTAESVVARKVSGKSVSNDLVKTVSAKKLKKSKNEINDIWDIIH